MLAADELKVRIGEGIMAFPATPFRADGALDEQGLEAHVAFLAAFKPTALVAAGGAGEIFSLNLSEHEAVVRATVRSSLGVPVIGGAGYGTALACEMARAVERAGADAVLLLPPYLIRSEQEGLYRHIRAVAAAVSIAVIPYSRDNAVIEPDTMARLAQDCPNVIALKDGTGNIKPVSELRRLVGDRLVIVNGAPTAEVYALPFQTIGVQSYSSAVFTFFPALATRFYQALERRDQTLLKAILTGFYEPLVKLRDRKRGYSVSIVKAGLRAMGMSAGPVRAPLVDFDPREQEALAALVRNAEQWLK
jgi:5-dehydro-4-deoxyglucarate dehydratase